MIKHEISPQAFEDAMKRAEDKFQEELENVDIRAVVLKTKKALIEQAMKNDAAYNASLDYDVSMKQFKGILKDQQSQIKDLKILMEQQTAAFKSAIELLSKKEEEEKKEKERPKGLRGFWEFIKCLMK